MTNVISIGSSTAGALYLVARLPLACARLLAHRLQSVITPFYQSFSPSQRAESYLNTQQLQRSTALCHRYTISRANTHADDPVHSAGCWYDLDSNTGSVTTRLWRESLRQQHCHDPSDISLNSSIRCLVKVVCATILRFRSSFGGE